VATVGERANWKTVERYVQRQGQPQEDLRQHRGELFYRLVQQSVAVSPAPYAAIIKHVRGQQGQQYNR
jgi:hypothetical protein